MATALSIVARDAQAHVPEGVWAIVNILVKELVQMPAHVVVLDIATD